MENEPPNLGLEDGTIDVEHLLVEPQDGHVSMDSIICFNEKIPENAIDMEEVSRCSGGANTGIGQDRGDILNGEVLDAMPGEVELGYFRLPNDFCSIGEEYLLGVEFAESMTNLDYVSNEVLQASDSQMHLSNGTDAPWKSDLFRIMEMPESHGSQFNVRNSESTDVPSHHERETLVVEKPCISPTCTLQNIDKSHNSSTCSFQDNLSHENSQRLSPSSERVCSPKIDKTYEFELMGQDGEAECFHGQVALETSAQDDHNDVHRMQKRSRKPTQRYIDEVADPISPYAKRRREVSFSTLKDKSPGVKNHKKCNTGSRAIKLSPDESDIKAIQVPFGSLVNNECPPSHAYFKVPNSDNRNSITKSKENSVASGNHKRKVECTATVHVRKKDECAMVTRRRKKDECATSGHVKKRDDSATLTCWKRKDDFIASHYKKGDDCISVDSSEEVSGRRKHHRLWTIAEVRKLIDGVSQYGVGRWSRIKKLLFSASAHRTSVDLKDKWRNLLKASGIQQGNQQGEKKRNLAWRPLPKSILRRVCELDSIYPYPKGRRHKIGHLNRDSPDGNGSTEITLNDYKRTLRSISDG